MLHWQLLTLHFFLISLKCWCTIKFCKIVCCSICELRKSQELRGVLVHLWSIVICDIFQLRNKVWQRIGLSPTVKLLLFGVFLQVSDILSEADTVLRCLKKSLVLKPTNTAIRVETAQFAITMFSFCQRQKRILSKITNGSPESEKSTSVLSELVQLAPMYLKGATTNYEKVPIIHKDITYYEVYNN